MKNKNKFRIISELSEDQKMDEFKQKASEISDVVLSIQDREMSSLFTETELKEHQNNLSYLLGEFNSAALALKEENPDRAAQIEAQMKKVDSFCFGAFSFLDDLFKKLEKTVPSEPEPEPEPNVSANQSKTGTIPKKRLDQTVQSENPIQPPSNGAESAETMQERILSSLLAQMRIELSNAVKEAKQAEFKAHLQNEEKPVLVGVRLSQDDPFANIKRIEQIEMVEGDDKTGKTDKADKRLRPIRPVVPPVNAPVIPPAPKPINFPAPQMKFDKISLMTFDGDRTKWMAFKNQIMDYIYDNPQLTPNMKFTQLQTHLTGQAADQLDGMLGSQADFQAAWDCLLERYDNEYQIVNAYLAEFFVLPQLKQYPTSAQFYQMVNKTKMIQRIMPSYNYDVSSWDPILTFCLISRLDQYSLRKWNDQVKKRQRIELSELLDFLEVQGSERISMQPDQPNPSKVTNKSQKNKAKNKAGTVLINMPEAKCIQCAADHLVFQCKIFKKLDIKDRIKLVRQHKHCLKCLQKHDGKECTFKDCKYCDKPHNHLLCYKAPQNKAQQIEEPSSEKSE